MRTEGIDRAIRLLDWKMARAAARRHGPGVRAMMNKKDRDFNKMIAFWLRHPKWLGR